MNNLRIAFIVNSFPAISETFILDQATSLLDLGHDVHIYAIRQVMGNHHCDVEKYRLFDRTCFIKMPETKRGRLFKLAPMAFYLAIRHPLGISRATVSTQRHEFMAGLAALRCIESQNSKKRYDIIHCHYGTNGRRFLLLKQILPAKYVVSFYGYDLLFYGSQGKKAYRALFRIADTVVANSRYTMEQLVTLDCPEDKIVMQPPGIFLDKFPFRQRTLESGGIIKLLSVGRLVEVKGIEYSIKAVAKLAQRYNIQYQIVGEGPEHARLQTLIERLSLSDKIHLMGELRREEVSELMSKAHLFLFPSVTARNGQQESGGGTVREAEACGIPVIASNIGGIPEGVNEDRSGFLVPERDVDSLADKLEYLIRHPEIWPEMGKAGRQLVEETFDIKKISQRFVGIYESLLNEPKYRVGNVDNIE